MKFYHFTAISLAESILTNGISKGHVKHSDGSIRNSIVWLTTDRTPDGHGLPTGGTIGEKGIKYNERVLGFKPKNAFALNKTRVRLTVDIADDSPTIIPFPEYYENQGETKHEVRLMGLSAHVDNPWRLSREQQRNLLSRVKTKESTWWLSFAPIDPSHIANVEYNTGGDFVPYDFETHGRSHFLDSGFAVASAKSLQSLQELVPSMHPHEVTKAVLFCDDPSHSPTVMIRGGGRQRVFDLMHGAELFVSEKNGSPEISAWIATHRAELQQCWNEAVDVYYMYYPDKGTPRCHRILNA